MKGTALKFKVGDKVKILPSAVDIGVSKSEVGTTQTILRVENLDTIIITSSDGGSWDVYSDDIIPVIVIGQQLLFDFMEK